MHPRKIQLDNKMQPKDAKASLGIATFLQSHLIPQKSQPQAVPPPNPALEPPQNQETGSDIKAEMQGLESRIFDELGTLKQEIQKVGQPKDQNAELLDLKKQIEEVLASTD